MSNSGNLHSNKTILVVDDQIDNLLLVTRYLSNQGYTTQTAADGEEAIAKATAEQPDLILLDVIMPGLNGYEVCRRLKNDTATMLIPLILVSTLDKKEDRLHGLSAGADEFLSKPVNAEELMLRVRSLLRLQDAYAAIEKQRIEVMQSRISAHVSPQLTQELLAASTDTSAALQDRESRVGAVIMNTGLQHFEASSERLSPDAVVTMLNEYFSCLTALVYRHSGTIFNNWGDSLLVGFGVPLAQNDSAERALKCSMAMQKEFPVVCSHWAHEFNVRPSLCIGINYGEVVVGNVGSSTYMRYAVIGDTVNHAVRLRHQAKEGETIVAERLALRANERSAGMHLQRGPEMQVPGASRTEHLYWASP